jgi:hypothetical protein
MANQASVVRPNFLGKNYGHAPTKHEGGGGHGVKRCVAMGCDRGGAFRPQDRDRREETSGGNTYPLLARLNTNGGLDSGQVLYGFPARQSVAKAW